MERNSIDPSQYFYLFSDCLVTKGYSRSVIVDTSRKQYYHIDNTYYEVLTLCREHQIADIYSMLESEDDIEAFSLFIDDLLYKGLGVLVDDIGLFPEVGILWEHHSKIKSCIVDVRDTIHDFAKIFRELDKLECQDIEIRFYSRKAIKELTSILQKAKRHAFKYMHILVGYSDEFGDLNRLDGLTQEFPRVYLTIFNTPKEKAIRLNESSSGLQASFIKQDIPSESCCGNIGKEGFQIPSIKGISENILFNGCLNRKIGIDTSGNIKNCPSMRETYGNIKFDSLLSILDGHDFKKYWSINKSKIKICSDCEYRSVCTDCRAYLVNPNDMYSKPRKCNYDPYAGTWTN